MNDSMSQVMAFVLRVQALSDNGKNQLLHNLVGRMIVLNPEGLEYDLSECEGVK